MNALLKVVKKSLAGDLLTGPEKVIICAAGQTHPDPATQFLNLVEVLLHAIPAAERSGDAGLRRLVSLLLYEIDRQAAKCSMDNYYREVSHFCDSDFWPSANFNDKDRTSRIKSAWRRLVAFCNANLVVTRKRIERGEPDPAGLIIEPIENAGQAVLAGGTPAGQPLTIDPLTDKHREIMTILKKQAQKNKDSGGRDSNALNGKQLCIEMGINNESKLRKHYTEPLKKMGLIVNKRGVGYYWTGKEYI